VSRGQGTKKEISCAQIRLIQQRLWKAIPAIKSLHEARVIDLLPRAIFGLEYWVASAEPAIPNTPSLKAFGGHHEVDESRGCNGLPVEQLKQAFTT